MTKINAVAVDVGVSGTLAGGLGVVSYDDTSTVNADIAGTINSNAGINIAAVSESDEFSTGAGLQAAGSAAVNGAIAAVKLVRNVQSTLGGTVKAKGNVELHALNDSLYKGAVAGVAIGSFNAAGSFSVLTDESSTNASVFGTIEASGDVEVSAKTQSENRLVTGSISGGLVALDPAIMVQNRTTRTNAIVADNAQITGGSFKLLAETSDTGEASVGAGGIGLYGAISVSVNVASSDSITRAVVGKNAVITATGNADIKARTVHNYKLQTGNLGAGAGNAGAAVTAVYINDTTSTLINEGAKITAKNVEINAISEKNMDLVSMGLSGGLGSISGSVVVLRIGTSINANDALNTALGKTTEVVQIAVNEVEKEDGQKKSVKESVYSTASTAAAEEAMKKKREKPLIAGYDRVLKMFNDSEYRELGISDMTTVLISNKAEINANGDYDITYGKEKKDGKVTVYVDSGENIEAKAGGYGLNAICANGSLSDVIINSNSLIRNNGTINANGCVQMEVFDHIGSKNAGEEEKRSTVGAKQGQVAVGGTFGFVDALAKFNGNAMIEVDGAINSAKGTIRLLSEREAYIDVVASDFSIGALDGRGSSAEYTQNGASKISIMNTSLKADEQAIHIFANNDSNFNLTSKFTAGAVLGIDTGTATADLCGLANIQIIGSEISSGDSINVFSSTQHNNKILADSGALELGGYSSVKAIEKLWDESSARINGSTLKAKEQVDVSTFADLEKIDIKADSCMVDLGSAGGAKAQLIGNTAHSDSICTEASDTGKYTINSLISIDNSTLESANRDVWVYCDSRQKDTNVASKVALYQLLGGNYSTSSAKGVNRNHININRTNMSGASVTIDAYSGLHNMHVNSDAWNSPAAESKTDADSTLELKVDSRVNASNLTITADEMTTIKAHVDGQTTSSKTKAVTYALSPWGKVLATNTTDYYAKVNIDPALIDTFELNIGSTVAEGTNMEDREQDRVEVKGEDETIWKDAEHHAETTVRHADTNTIVTLKARNNGFRINEKGEIVGGTEGLKWERDQENKIITITEFKPNSRVYYEITADRYVTGEVTFDDASFDGVIDNDSSYLLRFDNADITLADIIGTLHHESKRSGKEADTLKVGGLQRQDDPQLIINSNGEGAGVEFKNDTVVHYMDNTQVSSAGVVLNKGIIYGSGENDSLTAGSIKISNVASVGDKDNSLYVILTEFDANVDVYSIGDINMILSSKGHGSGNGEIEIDQMCSEFGDIHLGLCGSEFYPGALNYYKLGLVQGNNITIDQPRGKNSAIVQEFSETNPIELIARKGSVNYKIEDTKAKKVKIKAVKEINAIISGKVENLVLIDNLLDHLDAHIKVIKLDDYSNTPNSNKAQLNIISNISNGSLDLNIGKQYYSTRPVINVTNPAGNSGVDYSVTFDNEINNALCIIDAERGDVSEVRLCEGDQLSIVESDVLPEDDYKPTCDTLWLRGRTAGSAKNPLDVVFEDRGDAVLNVDAKNSVNIRTKIENATKKSTVTMGSITGEADIALIFATPEIAEGADDSVRTQSGYGLTYLKGKDITLIAEEGAAVSGDRVNIESRAGKVDIDLDLKAERLTVQGMEKADLKLSDNLERLCLISTEGSAADVTVSARSENILNSEQPVVRSIVGEIYSEFKNADDTLNVILDGNYDADAESGEALTTRVEVSEKGHTNVIMAGDRDSAKITGHIENATAVLEEDKNGDERELLVTDSKADTGMNTIICNTDSRFDPLKVEIAAKDAAITVNTEFDAILAFRGTNEEAGTISFNDVSGSTVVLKLEEPANPDTEYTLSKVLGWNVTIEAEGNTKVTGEDVTIESKDGDVVLNAALEADSLTVKGMQKADLTLTNALEELNIESSTAAAAKGAAVTVASRDGISIPETINAVLVNKRDTLNVEMNSTEPETETETEGMLTAIKVSADSNGTVNVNMKGYADVVSVDAAEGCGAVLNVNMSGEADQAVVNTGTDGSAEVNLHMAGTAGLVSVYGTAKKTGVYLEQTEGTAALKFVESAADYDGSINTIVFDGAIGSNEAPVDLNVAVPDADISADIEKDIHLKVTSTSEKEGVVDLTQLASGQGDVDLQLKDPANENTVYELGIISGTNINVRTDDDVHVTGDTVTIESDRGSVKVNADIDANEMIVTGMREAKLTLTDNTQKLTVDTREDLAADIAVDSRSGEGLPTAIAAQLKNEGDNLNVKLNGTETDPMTTSITTAENSKGTINVDLNGSGDTANVTAASGSTTDINVNISGEKTGGNTANVTVASGSSSDINVSISGDGTGENTANVTAASGSSSDINVNISGEGSTANVTAESGSSTNVDLNMNGSDNLANVTLETGSDAEVKAHMAGDADTVVVNGSTDHVTAILEKENGTMNVSDSEPKKGVNNIITDAVGNANTPMNIEAAAANGTITLETEGDIYADITSTAAVPGILAVDNVSSENGNVVLTLKDPASDETTYSLHTVSGADITIDTEDKTAVVGEKIEVNADGKVNINADITAKQLTVSGMTEADSLLTGHLEELTVVSKEGTTAVVNLASRDGVTLPKVVISDLVNSDDELKIIVDGTEDDPVKLTVQGTDRNEGKTELTLEGETDTVHVTKIDDLEVILKTDSLNLTDTESKADESVNNLIVDRAGSEVKPVAINATLTDTVITADTDGDVYIKVGIDADEDELYTVDLGTVRSENGTASVAVTKPTVPETTEEPDAGTSEFGYIYTLDAIEGKNVVLTTEDAVISANTIVLESTDPQGGTIKADADLQTNLLIAKNMAAADLKLTNHTGSLLVQNTAGMNSSATVGGKDGTIVKNITSDLKNRADRLNVIMSGDGYLPMTTNIRKTKSSRADYTVRFEGIKDRVNVYGAARVTVYLRDMTDPTKYIKYNGYGNRRYRFAIENLLCFYGEPIRKTAASKEPLVIFKLDEVTQITYMKVEDRVAIVEARDPKDHSLTIDPDQVIITSNRRMAEYNIDTIDIRMTDELHIVMDLKELRAKGMNGELTILYRMGQIIILDGEDIVLTFEPGTLLDEIENGMTVLYDGSVLRILDGEDVLYEIEISDGASIRYVDGEIVYLTAVSGYAA